MTAKVLVTISMNRWHKVVERLVALRSAAQEQMSRSVVARESMQTAGLFEKRQGEAAVRFVKASAEFDKAVDTILAIRQAIQVTNISSGIANRLAQLDALRVQATAVQALVDQLQSAVSLADAKVLAESRVSTDMYSMRQEVAIAAVDEVGFQVLKDKLNSLNVQRNNLADEISELNTTRVAIEIDADIAKQIGLV